MQLSWRMPQTHFWPPFHHHTHSGVVSSKLVIVFRGTKTTKEWVENATCSMQQLDGEPEESGLELFFNTNVMMATMVHSFAIWHRNALGSAYHRQGFRRTT